MLNQLSCCGCWHTGGALNRPGLYSHCCLYGTLSRSASQRKLTLWEDQYTGRVMLQTGWKEYEEAAQPAEPCQPIHLWFSLFLPLLQWSIFKTASVIRGKHHSSDTALAATPWMMSIISQQMTAIHPRAALSNPTHPYLADSSLSNANLPAIPRGATIPAWAPSVHQIGRLRGRDIPQDRSWICRRK